MIHLAFYKGTRRENPTHARWMDRLICWWTNSRFSHVEVVAVLRGSGELSMTWAASNRDGQVRATLLPLDNGRWHLVAVPAGQYAQVLAYFEARNGTPYGWLCALAHAVPPALRPLLRTLGHHLPYCSNIAAAAMARRDVWVTPGQLYEAVMATMGGVEW